MTFSQLNHLDSQLTFLVGAGHVVPVEAGEVALDAEPEAVPRPLQHPPLVLHPARQRHVLPLAVVKGLPNLRGKKNSFNLNFFLIS